MSTSLAYCSQCTELVSCMSWCETNLFVNLLNKLVCITELVWYKKRGLCGQQLVLFIETKVVCLNRNDLHDSLWERETDILVRVRFGPYLIRRSFMSNAKIDTSGNIPKLANITLLEILGKVGKHWVKFLETFFTHVRHFDALLMTIYVYLLFECFM